MQRFFCRWAAAVLLAIGLSSAVTPVGATHFHGGTMNLARAPLPANPFVQDKLRLVFESSWRISYGWPTLITLGATFNLGYTLSFTDALSGTTSVPIIATVVSLNPIEDLFTARFEYDYVTPNKFDITVDHQNGDRDSILAEGNHDLSWRITANAPAVGSTVWQSPRAVGLPRVYANAGAQLTLAVPVVQPSGLATLFGVAPVARSLLSTARPVGSAACYQPGPLAGPQVPSPSVNGASAPCICTNLPFTGVCLPAMATTQQAAGGIVTWTPAIPARYAVQFDVSSIDSNQVVQDRVPLDMVVAVTAPCPGAAGAGCVAPPTVSVASTYQATAGTALSIPVAVNYAGSASDQLYLFNTTLPSGATLGATSGTAPQLATTLNWTPGVTNLGDYPVCFQGSVNTSGGGKATSLGMPCVTITVPSTPPGVPTGVTATRGNASASVTFTAPAAAGSSAIVGYTVTSNPAGGTDSAAGALTTPRTITGLTNGAPYTFTVTAANAGGSGAASAPSNSVIPATVPSAPTIQSVTAGDGRVTVNVVANGNNGSAVTGLTAVSTPAAGSDTNAGSTGLSHVVTGLANGTAYTFRATATNGVGTGAPSTASTSVTPRAFQPTISMSFGSSPIVIGQTSPLTLTLTNPNPVTTLTGLAFTDTLPAGVSASAGTQSACGGTVTRTSTVISLAGGTLAANASCVITLNVTGAQASATAWTNTVSSVTTTNGTLQGATPSATANITVNKAATSINIISDTPDPSAAGTPVTVVATVAVFSPGTGTPSGNVLISDGVNTCTINLPAASCVWTGNTVGVRSLTAAYAGDSQFNASTSSAATHTVVPANQQSALTVNRTGSGGGSVASNDGFINCGATCTNTYAHTTVVTLTPTPQGGSVFSGWLGACTGKLPCALTISGPVALTATFAPNSPPLNLDIDGNASTKAFSDGLLIMRYLFSLSGTGLTGAINSPGTPARTTPADVLQYLTNLRPMLDVDGDGAVDAATDGVMLVRYLFGFRGSALIDNAVSTTARRTTATAIEAYIASVLP